MTTGQTNGDVWRQLVEQYNASQPPENRVHNPFDGQPGASPSKTPSNPSSASNKRSVDYPGKLLFDMEAFGVHGFIREHRFHPSRRWRLDLAHTDLLIGVECHGGVFTNGRHNRGVGFTQDREKMNAAIQLGWIVLEFTSAQIKSGEALTTIHEVHTNRILEFARG